ncbi:DUF663-domain-containing protein [Ramicandelaber brevisporus]|nr:DUF663-domain-containing protein [Ramicandelaber brevisporus]
MPGSVRGGGKQQQPFHHRATLKQTNKPFKSRTASKAELRERQKGRVERVSLKRTAVPKQQSKVDRRNAARIDQRNKRQALQDLTRMFSGRNGAPKVVAIVPLCPDVDSVALAQRLAQADDVSIVSAADQNGDETTSVPSSSSSSSSSHLFTLELTRFKQRLQVIPLRRNLIDILDAAKVADCILFALSPTVEVDAFGENALRSVQAQGFPTSIGVVSGMEAIQPVKKRNEIKKSLESFMTFFFPEQGKVYNADTAAEIAVIIRSIASTIPKTIKWRETHPYMLVESASITQSSDAAAAAADAADTAEQDGGPVGTLRVTGYLRGAPLSANRLVHIPQYGDFQIECIEASPDPTRNTRTSAADNKMAVDGAASAQVLDTADPSKQDSLVSENEPDMMANEQTWPTEEELMDGDERARAFAMSGMDGDGQHHGLNSSSLTNKPKRTKRVPKGTSAYQAAWIWESDNEDNGDEEDDDGSDSDGMDLSDADDDEDVASDDSEEYEMIDLDGEDRLKTKKADAASTDGDFDGSDVGAASGDDDGEDEDDDDMLEDDDEQVRQIAEYIKQKKEREQQNQEDLEFPDEVDTPMDQSARVRFQKYRGLQSMRTSPWDPYEGLPLDYGRIFQFENYDRTRKRVLAQTMLAPVAVGSRITIVVKAVPMKIAAELPNAVAQGEVVRKPLTIFGLHQYEHQMSIANFTVTRSTEYTEPVRSKDELIMMSGFRRFVVHPIYSQHTARGSNNVHKFERFLQPGRRTVATVYAPIHFSKTPCLLFKANETTADDGVTTTTTSLSLVATGQFHDQDPTRIIAKRIVLTGYPYKVYKKSCVIRHMFFNAEDIQWFKPVQLHTKYGHIGHIKESLGTHGYMKCLFDGPVKQHDTVCMTLFKRQFPKWNTNVWRDNGLLTGSEDDNSAASNSMDLE